MSEIGEGDLEYEYEDKMCSMTSTRDQIDLNKLKRLVKNSQYICNSCGRSAVDSDRLCSPVAM